MIEYSNRAYSAPDAVISSRHATSQHWSRALSKPLLLRPLLPLSLVALADCALGFALSRVWDLAFLQGVPAWLWPLLLLIFHGAALWSSRYQARALPLLWLMLGVLWTCHAASRVMPPPDDIAQKVRAVPNQLKPQSPLQVELRGTVARAPCVGDFGLEFPLQANRVLDSREIWRTTRGRVWVRLPLPPMSSTSPMLQEGDEISLRAPMTDLPRAGNLAEREMRARFLEARCWCLAQTRKNEDWKVLRRASGRSLSHRIEEARRAIAARYDASFMSLQQTYPLAMSQLLVAMVFGESGLTTPLPRATRDRFRAAGMSHILVASGTQVAFLGLALLGAARLVGLRRIGLLLLVVPVLLFYALLTGGASSIWRATLAGVCVAWALLLGRDVDGLSLWSLAVVVLLGMDAMYAQDLSFQLTFGATWGLLVLSPTLRKLLHRAWGESRVLDAAALTVSAQLATTPLLLYHFGRFSFVALGANFLAIPLAGILVGTGVLGLVLPLGALNYHLVRGVDNLATLAATAPGAQLEAPPLRLAWTILAYGLLLAALLSTRYSTSTNRDAFLQALPQRFVKRMQNFRPQGIAALLALILCMALMGSLFRHRAPVLLVTLLDVGQGESIVVQSPSGRTVLIDGGTSGDEGRGEVGRAVIVPFLQAAGITRLDAMVLTHADSDHCSALPHVLRAVPVSLALDGAALYAQKTASSTRTPALVPEYEAVKAAWREHNVAVQTAQSGQKLDLGEGAVLTVLAPTLPLLEGDNNNSTVLRLDYGATSFLFSADIETPAEERLARRGANLKCTVLKVAHHGSKTSSTKAFLEAAQPSLAVVSAGRYNRFKHPAPQVMSSLAARQVSTFRTDISGAIEVECDGRSCSVQTFR
jgi:competence protein ComEC